MAVRFDYEEMEKEYSVPCKVCCNPYTSKVDGICRRPCHSPEEKEKVSRQYRVFLNPEKVKCTICRKKKDIMHENGFGVYFCTDCYGATDYGIPEPTYNFEINPPKAYSWMEN